MQHDPLALDDEISANMHKMNSITDHGAIVLKSHDKTHRDVVTGARASALARKCVFVSYMTCELVAAVVEILLWSAHTEGDAEVNNHHS